MSTDIKIDDSKIRTFNYGLLVNVIGARELLESKGIKADVEVVVRWENEEKKFTYLEFLSLLGFNVK